MEDREFLTMYNNHRLYMINKTFDRVVILYDDLKVTTKIIDQRFLEGFKLYLS